MEAATALRRRKEMVEGAVASKGRQPAREEARDDKETTETTEEWQQRLVKLMSSVRMATSAKVAVE